MTYNVFGGTLYLAQSINPMHTGKSSTGCLFTRPCLLLWRLPKHTIWCTDLW